MHTHVQSAIRYICKTKRDEERDILTQIDRVQHTAIEVRCPRCEVGPGLPCKGQTPLAVHIERQKRAL